MLQWEDNSNEILVNSKHIIYRGHGLVSQQTNPNTIVIYLFLWGNLKEMFNRFLLYLKWIPQLSGMFFQILHVYFIYQDIIRYLFIYWYGILSHSINSPGLTQVRWVFLKRCTSGYIILFEKSCPSHHSGSHGNGLLESHTKQYI